MDNNKGRLVLKIALSVLTIIVCINFYSSKYSGQNAVSASKIFQVFNEENLKIFNDGEYKVQFETIKFEDNKLIINGTIEGPELKYEKGIVSGAEIEIVPKDFDEKYIAQLGENRIYCEEDVYRFHIEENYEKGVVQHFLDLKQKYLLLDIMIYKRNDTTAKSIDDSEKSEDENRDYRVYWRGKDTVIQEFKDIKVPFSY